MVYIALSLSYKNYDKISIESITFHKNGKIVFTYQAFSLPDDVLFTRSIILSDEKLTSDIKSIGYDGYTPYDSVCKNLLKYLVSAGIESGNIEVM